MVKKFGLVIMMLCLGVLFAAFLAGCHTVKGVGQDVGVAGNAIEKSSGK